MNAIILAAGNSTRMKQDGYSTPKPLLPILGIPNIERTVILLQEFGISEITIICKSDLLKDYFFLKEKYGCQLVHSPEHYNTLHSMSLVIDKIDDTFVIEGDVVFARNVFFKAKNSFYYTMKYTNCDFDAWYPVLKENRIVKFEIGEFTEPCLFGVSFWHHKDCSIVRSVLRDFFTSENFKCPDLFWDDCIVNVLEQIYIATYEISPADACEMNTGKEYEYAQMICKKYYQNCEKFILDFNCRNWCQPQPIEIVFVQDNKACQYWHQRLLDYFNSQDNINTFWKPIEFADNEYPFVVKSIEIGNYIAYFDVAESAEYILLRRLFVDEKYRHNGIGSIIVNYIREYAKLTNRELRVNVYDKLAEQFYIALGMKLYFKTFRFSVED